MEDLCRDLRDALRSLRRSRAFTLASLVTLGVAMGATTAIVSVVNAALLEPPPYPSPDRIVALGAREMGAQDGQTFHYLRDRLQTVERLAAYHGGTSGWNVVVGQGAEYAEGMRVSEGFFELLGVAPLLGRTFSRADDQANGPAVVMLSEPLWKRLLGGRRDAIGDIVLLGGIAHTVIGVMPRDFRTFPPADLWIPLRLSVTDNSWNYIVLGRLAPGIARADADAELATLTPTMQRTLRNMPEARVAALSWVPYQQWLGSFAQDELLLLLGAVVFLLLIACVNTASLQLSRAVVRRRELATRAALGSGPLGLVRLVLVESVALAAGGAALGLVLAYWALRVIVIPESLVAGPDQVLARLDIDLDWRVLGLTCAAALASGIFFGVIPAVSLGRINPRVVLGDSGRTTASRSTLWLRRGFTVIEIALAIVLLAGAGVLARTFANLRSVDPGFEASDVVVARMSLQGSGQVSSGELARFFDHTLARLRAVPGVTAAAVGSNVPVERGLNLPLEPPAGGLVSQMRAVDWRYVTPDYFVVFRIPVRAGRAFDERDAPGARPVALVNEAFVRTYFGERPAIGQFVQLARRLGDPPREIVGVVGDVKSVSGAGWGGGPIALASPASPTIYVPASQAQGEVVDLMHRYFPISWVVRTAGQADVVPGLQEALRAAAPLLPVIQFETMTEMIARDLEMQRFLLSLFGAFAGVALVLSAVGVYGLLAYATAQRRQEIGIRMALGATARRVQGAFLTEGLVLVVSGVILGLAGAHALSAALSSLVFGIEPSDPLTFGVVAAVLVLTSLVAIVIPARQASLLDPANVLRSE